jgi:Family of unknown function (DUF5808)
MRSSARFRKAGAVAAAVLSVAAVVTELRKPPAERTGFGTIAGVVPYDFRPPTPDRILASLWAPDDPRILKPHAFGVGWTLNFGRVVALLRRAVRG